MGVDRIKDGQHFTKDGIRASTQSDEFCKCDITAEQTGRFAQFLCQDCSSDIKVLLAAFRLLRCCLFKFVVVKPVTETSLPEITYIKLTQICLPQVTEKDATEVKKGFNYFLFLLCWSEMLMCQMLLPPLLLAGKALLKCLYCLDNSRLIYSVDYIFCHFDFQA